MYPTSPALLKTLAPLHAGMADFVPADVGGYDMQMGAASPTTPFGIAPATGMTVAL